MKQFFLFSPFPNRSKLDLFESFYVLLNSGRKAVRNNESILYHWSINKNRFFLFRKRFHLDLMQFLVHIYVLFLVYYFLIFQSGSLFWLCTLAQMSVTLDLTTFDNIHCFCHFGTQCVFCFFLKTFITAGNTILPNA